MLFLFHLEEWELRPPSNYQLSSRQMSHCCPSPVFTVSDKRIAASRMLCSNAAWKKANHLTALLLTASIFALLCSSSHQMVPASALVEGNRVS